jgi:carboxyl-terminal processing protease
LAWDDEPIYKPKQMHTVAAMLKRFLTVVVGTLVGLLLAAGAIKLSLAWSLWPNHELDRSSAAVREVLKLVNENYVDPDRAAYDRLAREAIHGLVETLDPHSEFLEAADLARFEDDLDGEFGGVGIQVESRHDRVVVIAPIAGTPAERAGIQRADEILTADGKELRASLGLDEVIDRLRGKPGSIVKLGVFRPGTQRKLEFTLVREQIKQQSVREVSVLEGRIGYIQLADFSARTGQEFSEALDGLLRQGVDSLVLDLRNNPGGLLEAAVAVAEPFFRTNELIVFTQGSKPGSREDFCAELDGEPVTPTMVVLINAGTASAAEVVTGALRDTGRAVIVGERSFGKGSVQSLIKLRNDTGVRLTTARYFTPGGFSIHEKGITPQIEVLMTPEEDNKLRLQRNRRDVKDPQEFSERFGFVPIEDRQLQAALDVLRAAELFSTRVAARPGSLP